jgi:hypothetical protein
MIGVQEFAEAAKRELGDALQREPVRVACPSCGSFVVSALSAPLMIRGRCSKCRVDVIALVSRSRDVLAVTEH